MSAYQEFLNAEFGDDKPISQRLVKEAHRIGVLGDSKPRSYSKQSCPPSPNWKAARCSRGTKASRPGRAS